MIHLESGETQQACASFSCAQAPSLKKHRGNFVDRVNKKVANLICFPNFPGKQQHFNVTIRKLVYCFTGATFCFGKINLTKVSEPFISPRSTRNFKDIFSTNPLYILHLYKQPTEDITRTASQQAGSFVFLTAVKCQKIPCLPMYK